MAGGLSTNDITIFGYGLGEGNYFQDELLIAQ